MFDIYKNLTYVHNFVYIYTYFSFNRPYNYDKTEIDVSSRNYLCQLVCICNL